MLLLAACTLPLGFDAGAPAPPPDSGTTTGGSTIGSPPGGFDSPADPADSATDTAHTAETADSTPPDAPTPDTGPQPLPGEGEGNGVVRFVVFGDWGNGSTSQVDVAESMDAVCGTLGCDFALTTGDNFYPSGVVDTADVYWTDRFEDVYPTDIPFYATLGNHDWGGGGGGYESTAAQAQVDYSAVSGRWTMPGFTWTADFADLVSLVALDTNSIFKGYGADQEAWIDDALADRPAPWRIVVGHHPWLSNGHHGNAGEYDGVSGRGDELLSFFETHLCDVADVYLAGHDHNLQWLEPPCSTELIVSGGGGGYTTLEGVNPAWFEASSAGFVWMEATSTTLRIVFYDADGVALYEDARSRP